MKYNLLTFPASAAERASGLSQMMQRDWRKRGLLPPVAGKARFSIFDIAQMKLQKDLSDRGLGPSASASFGSSIAALVVRHVVANPAAWRGIDNDAMYLPGDVVRDIFNAQAHAHGGVSYWFDIQNSRGRYYVLCPDGTGSGVDDVGAYIGHASANADGPFIVINVESVARSLVAELGQVIEVKGDV